MATSSPRPAASPWPPTSPAATSTMRSPASSCALAMAASTPSTKGNGASGSQPWAASRCVTTTTWSIPPGGFPSQPSVMSKTWRPTSVAPIWSQYGRVLSEDVCDTFTSPLSSNATSPLDNQSNSGPGWSFASATKPSTDTELYMTTLPTGPSSPLWCPTLAMIRPPMYHLVHEPDLRDNPTH